MDIFNINLPSDEENEKFKKIDSWFDHMNEQFQKIEESNEKFKINNILLDNDIDIIE